MVAIDYKLTNDNNEILDQSPEGNPLVYLHGAKNIIPGLEKSLLGKGTGDELKVTVQPEEGYGQVHTELVQSVPIGAFKEVEEVKVGMQFEIKNENGHVQIITVQEVTEDNVKVDGNHPLAGQILHFDVKVGEIREATAEELDHGHSHGTDCSGHE